MAAGARAPKETHRCACGVAVTIAAAFSSLPISAQSPAGSGFTGRHGVENL
jgi:hypothetical protein